jgi:CHAT domain-containing protein
MAWSSKKLLFTALLAVASNQLFIEKCYSADSEEVISLEEIKTPPRDIKDILRVIEQTKQDREQLDKAKRIVALPAPTTKDQEVLNHFYYRKAYAEEILGNSKVALEDLKRVINEFPSKDPILVVDELAAYASLEAFRGNRIVANEILEKAKSIVPNNYRGRLLGLESNTATNCLVAGDFDCAKASLNRLESYYASMSNARNAKTEYKLVWQANFERTRANLFASEGKYIEAERSLRQALRLNETILSMIKDAGKDALDNETRIAQDASSSLKSMYLMRVSMMIDMSLAFLGQRRLIDAEFWAREAVSLAISRTGVNSFQTSRALLALTRVVSEQGRQPEAVLLAEAALKSAKNSTNYAGSPQIAAARKALGTALAADGKYLQADKIFTEMVDGIKADPQIASRYQVGDLDWALSLIKIGKASQAVSMTTDMLSKDGARLEKNSTRLAMIRAFNASGLEVSGQSAQALAEFKQSIPILIDQSRADSENSATSIRQTQRMTFVLEEYLAALATQAKSDSSGLAAAEAFQVADLARGSGVQRALTSSAARANISDPQLASLARREQDLQQRINTLSELLTGLLSAPPDQQLPGVQTKIRADIASFRSQREDLKKEIERKFPDYAELMDPKPASVERTQKSLKPDEVLVVWYFADNVGYVWAITKDKPVQFVQIPVGRVQIAKEVAQLRKALDPGVATIDEIPAFDVALAYQLYQQILFPVQSSFSGKKIMLTVPHAELGQLPLSLLVTKQTTQPAKVGATAFIGYRTIPWLTRDIAVAQIPSVTALTALRSLPPGNPNRKNFIGFGDPYFSGEQEKTAQKQAKLAQLSTRGAPLHLRSAPKTAGVSSAELALLPRLPDTSLELEEVGKAVGAADSDIYLHKQASVKQVMSMDLTNRKVVMFATHGLIPGELNGLTQPALALSSPEVTGDKDDGLLTMDKVLTLKLDADWVVLSACNTASGEGAGAEAVSGLGRAFFFAGAKALLVSNWPVDSVASRTMMTDLFKNQQKTGGGSKAELLRQAMLNQIDQGGMKEGDSMKYAYAHPLFWAPFVVVGD